MNTAKRRHQLQDEIAAYDVKLNALYSGIDTLHTKMQISTLEDSLHKAEVALQSLEEEK